jgi:hypothetical protein
MAHNGRAGRAPDVSQRCCVAARFDPATRQVVALSSPTILIVLEMALQRTAG